MKMSKTLLLVLFSVMSSAAFAVGWSWRMPGSVYKDLDFTDRAQVDRATKIFEQALNAESRGLKVTELVPRYRNAAGEWRKVQVQAETSGDGDKEALLAYAVFMQGYAKQHAHDRNEAIKLYSEVLDLYPEQKFVSVLARYLISRVRRQVGDIKQANADLEEIITDPDAEKHAIYWDVVREVAGIRWDADKIDEAADLWAKIVFSKANIGNDIVSSARWNLMVVRIIAKDYGGFEEALFANVDKSKKKRAAAVQESTDWMSGCSGNHPVAAYLERKYPDKKNESKRGKELAGILKSYAEWLERQSDLFAGEDDGWRWELLRFWFYRQLEKPSELSKRIVRLKGMVKGCKPELLNGRARTLAMILVKMNRGDEARSVAAMPKDAPSRLRLQSDVEAGLGQWKEVIMYLTELVSLKPPLPSGEVKSIKYDMANIYRRRLGAPDKAVKLYLEIDDPPQSLWGLAEALRESGKKNESYTTLTEIASIFPNDAPSAVLRAAQWREQDGAKETAIALYKRLLSHPKWKETGASSAAHQALERLGIATGGAMTNEVR